MQKNCQEITHQVLEQLNVKPISVKLVPAPVMSSIGHPIQVLYSRWGAVRAAETKGSDGLNRHFKTHLQVLRRERRQPITFISNTTFYLKHTPLLRTSTAFCPKKGLLSFGIAEKIGNRVEKMFTVTVDKSHARKDGVFDYYTTWYRAGSISRKDIKIDTKSKIDLQSLVSLWNAVPSEFGSLSKFDIFEPYFDHLNQKCGFAGLDFERLLKDCVGPPMPRAQRYRGRRGRDTDLKVGYWVGRGSCWVAGGLLGLGAGKAHPIVGAAVGGVSIGIGCGAYDNWMKNKMDEIIRLRDEIERLNDEIERLKSEIEEEIRGELEENEEMLAEAQDELDDEENALEEAVPDPEDDPGEYGSEGGEQFAESSSEHAEGGGGGGGGCFRHDTIVSQSGKLIVIANLKPGDFVSGYDIVKGVACDQHVLRTWSKKQQPVLALEFGAETIVCTASQPFFTGVWMPASELRKGDRVLSAVGEWVPLTSTPQDAGFADIRSLDVRPSRTFYVGKLGLLSHNKEQADPWGDDLSWEG